MKNIFNLTKYEFRMSISRPGQWIGFGFVFLLYASKIYIEEIPANITDLVIWQTAGRIASNLNLFMPVIGGILAADRISRDFSLGVHELQQSTNLKHWHYIFGKYFGVLFSFITIQFIFIEALALIKVIRGFPISIALDTIAAFLLIIVPAFIFVTIFSLTIPLLMNVRTYQILFTGYWIWGNYLDPNTIPSISDTVLNVCGRYATEVIFKTVIGRKLPFPLNYSDVFLNWAILLAIVVGVFIALKNILEKRTVD
jgi:hypothetical protein